MPLYVKPDTERVIPRVGTFYADDSICHIGGVKHTLLGAISFPDEQVAIGLMLDCKRQLGVAPNNEIKWNSRFTEDQRHFITEALIPVLSNTIACLTICEHGKHKAALYLATQLADFSRAHGLSGFFCRFDRNIITDQGEFDRHVYSLVPPCAGWSQVDSAHEPLIQFADLFVGFQKRRIEFGTGRAEPNKIIEFEFYEGERDQFPLGWLLFAALRRCLWGKRESDDTTDAWKNNLGRGVRVHSSVAPEIVSRALSHIERESLGCLH
jgi:hypothetical protein